MILIGNQSKTLPKIIFEETEGTLKLSGRSISPEIESYFGEFLSYLNEYLTKNPMDLKIDVDFEYFNTKTSKLLLMMFDTIKKVEEFGFRVIVDWYYEWDDDDMAEAGGDYESLTGMKFNFIEKPEKSE